MHGIHVREHQNTGALAGLGAARNQNVSVAVAARDALDAGPDAVQVLLHPVGHPVHGGGIVGG